MRGKIEKAVGEEEGVDKDAEVRYNKKDKQYSKKKLYYSQYQSSVMQWAFATNTKPGDVKTFYNPIDNTWNKLVADDSEDRYGLLLSIEDTLENAEAIRNLFDEAYDENYRTEQRDSEGVHENYDRYWSLQNKYGDDNINVEESGSNERARVIFRAESESDGSGDSRQGTGNRRTVKYSLKDPTSDEIERERN